MGRGRTSPKYLKGARQRKVASANMAMMSLFHGNPNGSGEVYWKTVDGRHIYAKDVPEAVSKERKEILKKALDWGSDFHANVHSYCYIKIINDHYPSGLKRYFSGEKHFFMFEDEEAIYTSIVYSSKALAMLAFNTGRVTWISRQAIPSPVP